MPLRTLFNLIMVTSLTIAKGVRNNELKYFWRLIQSHFAVITSSDVLSTSLHLSA